MYVPEHFAEGDLSRAEMLVREFSFATLISYSDQGIEISHIPLVLDGDLRVGGTLIGHFARENPHVQMGANQKVTAIFHGPDAYVSPTCYAGPGVPTWNYCAVHCHGLLEFEHSEAALRSSMEKALAAYEPSDGTWSIALLADTHRKRLFNAIQPFRIRISSIEAKFKLSQNRSVEDQWRVIHALEGQGGDNAACVAEYMRANCPSDD